MVVMTREQARNKDESLNVSFRYQDYLKSSGLGVLDNVRVHGKGDK